MAETSEEKPRPVEHIQAGQASRVAYCGVALPVQQSFFFSVDHAIASMKQGYSIVPCPACARKVIEWMRKVQALTE